MLTSCPKCGFSQPKDQYCAQCGVDMLAFRAPEKSFWNKLSESLFFQLSMVVVIGAIAVLFITRNQKESFWSRVEFLRGSTSTQVTRSKDGNNFAVTQSFEENVPAATIQTTEQVSTAPVARTLVQPKAQLLYIEVPPAILSKWLEENVLTRVETSGEITIGYIPQFEQILEQYKAQLKVLKTESFDYSLNQLYTSKMEKPNPVPASSTGRSLATTGENPEVPAYFAYATLDDDRNETLLGQLEISTNPQTSYPAHFEMNAGQAFFMSGFTRARNESADRSLASETIVVFRIDK